jgi:hypothetical protein
VQVHHGEGVAIHIDPESCAAAREGNSEALTGERAGQPLSRESTIFPGADVVPLTEGNTDGRDIARPRWPGVVADTGMRGRSLHGNREISRPTVRQLPPVRIGKARSRSR